MLKNVISKETSITIALTFSLCAGAYISGGTIQSLKMDVSANKTAIEKQEQKIDLLQEVATDLKRRTDLLEYRLSPPKETASK